jgi:hypothetical protein
VDLTSVFVGITLTPRPFEGFRVFDLDGGFAAEAVSMIAFAVIFFLSFQSHQKQNASTVNPIGHVNHCREMFGIFTP